MEAGRDQFAPEPSGIVAPLRPPPFEKRHVRLEYTKTLGFPPKWCVAEAQPAAHRLAFGAKQLGNAAQK